jgi:opacity protein-like surface antigen
MKKITILCLLFMSVPAQAQNSQWVEWIGDLEVAYGHNNNLNLSAFNNDEESDNLIRVTGDFGRYYQFNGTTRGHVAVELASETYGEFELMDNLTAGINLGLRHKFGVGLDVPYLQLNLSYKERSFDADVRDRTDLDASIELGKQFSERFSLAGNFMMSSIDGESGPTAVPGISNRPFDEDFWHASLIADYVLSQNWLVSVDYAFRSGDFHSSCTPTNVAIVLSLEPVQAITLDPAFNGCVYQLDGDARILSTNLSYAVSNHSAINFGIQFYEGDADVLSYSGRSFQLSFNYRY